MKRSIITILFLYLFSISGLAASFHFCNNELETVSISFSVEDKCCCDGAGTCKSCCKNEQFKPDLSQHFAAKQLSSAVNELFTIVEIWPVDGLSLPQITSQILVFNSRKEKPKERVFVRNCNYRL